MNKLFFTILMLLLSLKLLAQGEDQYAFYYDTILKSRAATDLETSFQYLDSVENLGEDFQWTAKLIRVDLYRFIEDSVFIADQLVNECIAHYKENSNTTDILSAYNFRIFISKSMRDIPACIKYTNEAILTAEYINDSTAISRYEIGLGSFYLYHLSDTINALKHYNKALDIALKKDNWFFASWIEGELIDYYLLVKNVPEARKQAHLSVLHSSKMDSMNSLSYDGFIYRATFFLKQEEYAKAIQDGLKLYHKGKELRDYDCILWAAFILTEAYWKFGMIEKAYSFSKIALNIMEGEGALNELKMQYYWSSKIYAAKGLHKQALELLERFYAFEKLDYEKLEVKAIARTLYEGELKRKELENEKIALNLSLTEERSNFKSMIIAGFFILCIIILIYSVILYKKRQKAIQLNKILAASNEVILQQKELLLENIEVLKKDLDYVQQDQGNETFYFSQSAIQLNFTDIIYLESSNNYVLIHVVGRETPLLERIKMIELVKEFPNSVFVKTHRSFFVNKKHIVARPSKYLFEMSNGVQLNASRSFVDNLNGILT